MNRCKVRGTCARGKHNHDRGVRLLTNHIVRPQLFLLALLYSCEWSGHAYASAQNDEHGLPRCFNSSGSFEDHIKGRWVLTAPEQLDTREEIENIKCKTQGGGPRTCVAHNRKQKDPLPVENGRSRVFEPSNCRMDPYSPSALENAIGSGRHIYMFGDSILMQQKGTVRCDTLSVINSTTIGRSLNFKNGGKISFYRVSTTKHLEKQLAQLKNSQMTSKDVCVFNVGVHYNTQSEYKKDFLDYFEENCLKKTCLPCQIVWRESSHQHFPGPLGGLFVKSGKCTGCTAVSESKMLQNNWRNDMANTLLMKYRVPIMRVWYLTAIGHDMHPMTGGYAHATCDCTHFCSFHKGVYEAWTTVLQNFLAVL